MIPTANSIVGCCALICRYTLHFEGRLHSWGVHYTSWGYTLHFVNTLHFGMHYTFWEVRYTCIIGVHCIFAWTIFVSEQTSSEHLQTNLITAFHQQPHHQYRCTTWNSSTCAQHLHTTKQACPLHLNTCTRRQESRPNSAPYPFGLQHFSRGSISSNRTDRDEGRKRKSGSRGGCTSSYAWPKLVNSAHLQLLRKLSY